VTHVLAERLRDADPVSSLEGADPDDALLSQILTISRTVRETPPERLGRRRALLILAAAIVVIGGLAAAGTRFAPHYFGASDREPTSAAVLAELRQLAHQAPQGFAQIDSHGLIRLAAFNTAKGRATIYAAPTKSRTGFCQVEAIDEAITGGSCFTRTAEAIPVIDSGSSDWGDVRVLLGRLEPASDRIELRFEDGSVRDASIRAPWWVYVVGGGETDPGHRPLALIALDSAGAIVAKQALVPYSFTSRSEVERLLPESDGSPGQNAIRSVLAGLGSGPSLERNRIEIDHTHLLRRIRTGAGKVDVYVAPWGRGGLCYGYTSSIPSFEPLVTGCPANTPLADQPSRFEADSITVARLAPSVFILEGSTPREAARVRIVFEDGASVDSDLFVASAFASWIGPSRLSPGHRPLELVAFDSHGREIAAYRLDPRRFGS
jgi:hypothetical protein